MRIFVTATGTDRGKTLFVSALMAYCKKRGIDMFPFKPIQSGAEDGYDVRRYFLEGEEALKNSMEYIYKTPASPHLAAEIDGLPYPCVERIVDRAKVLEAEYKNIVIEGAGGLLVPIDRAKKLLMIDLVVELKPHAILVVQSSLGAINDALLSIEAMKSRGICVEGFVLNDIERDVNKVIKEDNRVVIEEFSGVPCLGALPYIEDMSEEGLARVFASGIGVGFLSFRGL